MPFLYLSEGMGNREFYKNMFNSLKLNGHYYSKDDLIELSGNIIRSESTPGWQKKIYLFIQEWLSDEAFIESRTSGSTGKPKVIRIEKVKMIKSARRTGDFLKLDANDSALLCLPIDFIAGKMMVVRSFVLGLDLYYVNPVSNPLKQVERDFGFAAMTPMQVHNILEDTGGQSKMNSIEKLIIGGGEIDPSMNKKVSLLNNLTYQTYGMTETITHIAMKKLSGPGAEIEYRVLDGISIETDVNQCLMITDELLEIFSLKTNDIVGISTGGTFHFIGRFDHIINSGGIKVIPEVVEKKLGEQIINRIAVVGKKDKMLGEKVVLVIEKAGVGIPDDLEKKIKKASLERYETPREIKFVDHFPESSNGKILRSKLQEILEKTKL